MITNLDIRKVECAVRATDQLGETPLWCEREKKLWWLDIERPKLQSFDPATGKHEVQSLATTFLGSQALGEDGSHLLALDLQLHRRSQATGSLVPFAHIEQGLDNRLNDGRVDARGRFWRTCVQVRHFFFSDRRDLVCGERAHFLLARFARALFNAESFENKSGRRRIL